MEKSAMAKARRIRDGVFEADLLQGTYIVYGATSDCITPFACDVYCPKLEEATHREFRAYQQQRQAAGKGIGRRKKDHLGNELLVIFGPELSPSDAVKALQLLIANIRKNGLLNGRTEKDGDFLVETMDGEIVR
jgi:hypothetical protein